jgi:hypothetical protein
VRSSSLIEVTTALIIISVVFVLALTIFMNVQRSGFSARKLACQMMIEAVYQASLKDKHYNARTASYNDIVIYQEVIRREYGLLQFTLEARDQEGKVLAEQKHLVYVPE